MSSACPERARGDSLSDVLIGLDVGTTRVKALAVDPSGAVLVQDERPTPWQHDGALSQIDPSELAAVCIALAGEVGTGHRVCGIGVTSVAETAVLIDETGKPCAPAFAWHDPRGEWSPILEAVGATEFHCATGMKLNSKPSISKVLWQYEHVDGARNAVRMFSVADWIVRELGGEEVAELSLVSRSGMFDIVEREPWTVANELVGALIPDRRIVAGEHAGVGGGAIPDVLRGAALTSAGHDHQAAAFAMGASRHGALLDSLGTAEALLLTISPSTRELVGYFAERDINVGWGVIPDHLVVLAGMLTGLCLERVSAMLGASTREQRAAIANAALRTDRSGVDLGITRMDHDRLEFNHDIAEFDPGLVWRVAVEDLTGHSAEIQAIIEAQLGPHKDAMVTGGWLHDAMVRAAKQEQFPAFSTSQVAEPGALGAAFMSGIAAGVLQRPGPNSVPQWNAPSEVTSCQK